MLNHEMCEIACSYSGAYFCAQVIARNVKVATTQPINISPTNVLFTWWWDKIE
jgi:hypothetical protein